MEIKPIGDKYKFEMSELGKYLRLNWVFESNLEKAMLTLLIILGLWKFFGLVANLIT